MKIADKINTLLNENSLEKTKEFKDAMRAVKDGKQYNVYSIIDKGAELLKKAGAKPDKKGYDYTKSSESENLFHLMTMSDQGDEYEEFKSLQSPKVQKLMDQVKSAFNSLDYDDYSDSAGW